MVDLQRRLPFRFTNRIFSSVFFLGVCFRLVLGSEATEGGVRRM